MSEATTYTEMLRQGIVLRGVYRIDGYLASGGFGNTYRVTHTELGEQFAIKEFFMKGVSERDDDSTSVRVSNTQNRNQFANQLRKFKKEALRLRKMHNAHIVRVHDLFEANGTAYYVMDFIDGESLSARLRRNNRPMPENEVRAILPQLLDALEVVHATGFQHLDLKPANIMIDRRGKVALIDFGASKQLDLEDGASTSSTMAYTPGYAPREQVEQNISKLGPWTDLYALGATLYNLLTTHKPPLTSDIDDEGERAFDFHNAVTPKMRSLILWMMTPRRDLRPQSVEEVRERIAPSADDDDDTIVDPQPPLPTPDPSPTPDPKPTPAPTPKPEKPSTKLIAIIVAVVLGAVLTWWILNHKKEPDPDEPNVEVVNEPVKVVEEEVVTTVTNASYSNPVMGKYTYTGPVDADRQPHGNGTATLSNGGIYTGDFDHGTFQGKAKYVYPEGDSFEGTFRNNQFHEGTYKTAKGDFFQGTFANGQPKNGTWYNSDGTKIQ